MTEDLKREAYERLQDREAELGRLEQELAASELALDTRWAGHERRLKVLEELYEYVHEREMTLRERALRLRLPPQAIDELLPAGSLVTLNPVDMSHVAVSMERAAVIEERERLSKRREALLLQRRQLLDEASRSHSWREEALIDREQILAVAFRHLVQRAGELASSPPPRRTVSSPPPEAPADLPLEKLEVVPILDAPDGSVAPLSGGDGGRPPSPDSTDPGRRASPRVEVSVRVHVESPHNFFAGETGNLGVGGLFVVTENLLPVGRNVLLRLTLADQGVLKLSGQVAWRREGDGGRGPAGLGIQFKDVDEAAGRVISRFVEERLPDPV